MPPSKICKSLKTKELKMNSSDLTHHHEFSPSKLERLANCPWSWRNCKDWKSEDSKNSMHGTLLHRAVYDDEVFDKLSEKDREIVAAIRREHVEPFSEMEHYHELHVDVRDNAGNVLTEGTLDYLVISPDGKIANLKDWKFGGYEVTKAASNPQLRAYAAGVFQRFRKLEKIFVMVVQPLYDMDDYDSQAEFSRDDVFLLVDEIAKTVDKAKSATEADASPSAENCRYCNREHCAPFRRKMEANFAVMEISPEKLSDQEKIMTVDYADRIITAEKEIKSIMELKTKPARKCILDHGGSENYRVAAGRVTSKTDWKALCADLGISEDVVSRYTESKQGEPFITARMRKKQKPAELLERT